jgi:hypothetical protein
MSAHGHQQRLNVSNPATSGPNRQNRHRRPSNHPLRHVTQRWLTWSSVRPRREDDAIGGTGVNFVEDLRCWVALADSCRDVQAGARKLIRDVP